MEDVTPALVKFALEPAVGCRPEEKKSEKKRCPVATVS